jgi:aminopeptidase
MALLDDDKRARYAEAIVSTCLGLSEGEYLLITGEPAHRELVVALNAAAYRLGARLVDSTYVDPLVRRARIEHAAEGSLGQVGPWSLQQLRALVKPDAAIVGITGEEFPGLLGDLPSERVALDLRRAAEKRRFFVDAQTNEKVRFCVVGWPTEPWARRVYPELDPEAAVRRLADDILWFCRLGPDDPPGVEGWARHLAMLRTRAEALESLGAERLELRGPGTLLDVGFAPGTRILHAAIENAYGQTPCVNLPTEEVFTSPDPRPTEGTFRCSRPLSFAGRTIDGLEGEFRRGRLVRLDAAREEERDFMAAYLDTDRGARRLGEVALVDRASRIGQSGRVYGDTLFDENAASHIAFGSGFAPSRSPNGRPLAVNNSSVHLDVMIGSDDLEITAVTPDGRRVEVIRGGAWQLAGATP